MIFLGRKHPIFSSYIESDNILHFSEFDTLKNLPIKGVYLDNLDINKKYFMHSEIPLVSPSLDVEYIFNIEDQMTLFRNIGNGNTEGFEFCKFAETEFIKYVLEDKRCKKIICHIQKMSEALPILLKSQIVKNKTEFRKIGIPYNGNTKKITDAVDFTILFTNSYANWDQSFFLRGGHFLLKVFFDLLLKYPNIKLILRSNIPANIVIPKIPNIRVIKETITEEELDNLYSEADVCVLPSCRVHSHSICKSFSYGLPVVSTNGWGIDEYIKHEYNGLIINGFDRISWHNVDIGCIENYSNINDHSFIKHVNEQLYYYLEFLINNRGYLSMLGENCKKTCESEYSLSNWNSWTI